MATPRIDIAGQVFGRLTAKSFTAPIDGKRGRWLCECECGTESEVLPYRLRSGHTQSCGCLRHDVAAAKRIDLTGQVFGRLTVVAPAVTQRAQWLCKCKCGNEREVFAYNLKNGNSSSCGCLNLENHTAHGHHDHPLYGSWNSMKARCYNTKADNYHRYGGKGVTVCDRWLNSPAAFFEDMGEKPHPTLTVDRIDTKGNYEPANCRWATPRVQACNRQNNALVPGVHFDGRKNKYIARIVVGPQRVHLGSYKQHSDAAQQRLSYEALVEQGATASHLKRLKKFIKAVTGNKKVREQLYA